jgi:hypothetical protein
MSTRSGNGSAESPRAVVHPLINEACEIVAIITAIIVKAKSNPGRGKSADSE